MRLAELSSRSGVSAPTIKHYLRVGVLHPGERQSATWATYDESHVRRLALVRALVEVAGLPLEDVRRVLAAVDDERLTRHQALGSAQWALSPSVDAEPTTESLARVDALLQRHGWPVHPDSPHRTALAAALDTVDRLDFPADDAVLDQYADALAALAPAEVDRIRDDAGRTRAMEQVVVGTLLYEPVLTTLRRMAHEAVSAWRS